MRKPGQNVKPRTGETHGLFGTKFLKNHNIRDPNWTAEDLVTQYDKLSNIYRKANRVAELQREQDEGKTIERYNRMKEDFKQEEDQLITLLRGDVQRTKNVLQENNLYQRMYKNKQSFELEEELEIRSFLKNKMLNCASGDKKHLAEKYEDALTDAALQQEMIRYYDVTEFNQEIQAKALSVELKNSETRNRDIDKKNSTYKKVIGQMLRDSMYYQPVYEAVSSDWKEQTKLVEQTYEIGFPAMSNVNKLKNDMNKLQKLSKNEEKRQQATFMMKNRILLEYPSTVKQLVRRDSDFSLLGERYERKTTSMMNLKVKIEDVETTMKILKEATMCHTFEDIFPWMQHQPIVNEKIVNQIEDSKKIRDINLEKDEVLKFVTDLMFDDLPDVYKEEKRRATVKQEQIVVAQKDKRKQKDDHLKAIGEIMVLVRFGLHHLVDALRHVQSADFKRPLIYPTIDLKLPLLRNNLPKIPEVVDANDTKLLESLSSLCQLMMLNVQKDETLKALEEANSQFQQAVIEDSLTNPRSRSQKMSMSAN